MSEDQTSIEQAGGCAVGLTGTISAWNADAEANLCKALKWVGEYVEHEADVLLGHIKAAVVNEAGEGITLNLTNMESGIEHHGTLGPQEKVKFSFMAAVLDVDEHELDHMMFHAIDDCGIDYELDEAPKCSCGCHDHDHHHEHEHHHEHGEECHCHDHDHHHGHDHHHEHGEECHCHDHEHEHHHGHDHHHEHGEECHCHDHEEEEHCECHDDKAAPGVHYYHHYIHEYHYYYHFDDLDEVHKAYLRKHAHHHEHGEECHCHDHDHHHEHEHHHAHYHADGSECHCHDPDECDQKHYHADGSECHCHDHGNEEHCSCCDSKQ